MCAIFGFIDSTLGSEQVRLNLLKSASDCLRHRGPDDEGYAYFPLGAFGHRRLAIIDLQSGAQPMVSSDGRYTLVFNGEIYNFMEIKDELMSLGARFQTNSDTEVLLVGYITWGFDVVKKLNGMFAFSIWDSGTETLFAARDPFGQKPFFYWAQDKSFYFGSELRIFSNWSHLGIEPDLDQIGLFLKYESFLDRSTAYKNVYKLRPGHYLTFAKGILNEENYF